MDIDKYDEYHRGVEREVVTIDTKIKPTNKGFAMLAKLGWVEGQPLGLSGEGRVEPIPFYIKNDLAGLGKHNQDMRWIESTVAQRRELDSEKQIKETEEQRKARESMIAKRVAVQSEVSAVLRPFYCELCDKQFQNVAQYDEHTNSYAHHHKARFRDLQASQRATANFKEELDKRKEKERKREEKELRKLAKAAGIKLPKPAAPPKLAVNPVDGDAGEEPLTHSKWASLGASSSTPSASAGPSVLSQLAEPTAVQASAWTSLGSTNDIPPRIPEQNDRGPTPSGPSPNTTTFSPAFRTGGWSSLESAAASVPAPPPSQAPSAGSAVGLSTLTSAHSSFPMIPPTTQEPASVAPVSVTRPAPQNAAERQESSRSGWQQFRSGGSSRRR
ncbi:G-patch-domain Zn-finger DNA-binding protein [Cristinia sonorae]|uniref:G-patch-domain Zn-finger DNA-binding protein n=1 Tax=Cristinia sonorae TaxID=1940300 RepID=A0A8K0UPP6_9AGAR|nr:G-patch-domain Zn-finger DNA-binding protein [Cristinia sonorae]